MRKSFYLLIIQLMCLQTVVYGQMFFTVELQEDQVTYVVKVRPEVSYAGTLSITNNAQLSFVVPTGGFKADSIKNITGNWVNDNNVVAPEENPEKDYLVFNLSGNISTLEYITGVENELFSFKNVGKCTGTLDFITEDDPFFFNSKNINIGNQISVLGAGFGNAFSGTYGPEANCLQDQVGIACELIDSIVTTNPSQCGIVPGTITIYATPDTEGLLLQYSINGGQSFQNDPTFTDLVSGKVYNVWVRDEIPLCIQRDVTVELGPPADAIIIGTSSTPDNCTQSDGMLTIDAIPIVAATTLEYSIDEGVTWLENDGLFTDLVAGTYRPRVRAKDAPCHDDVEAIVVATACSGDGEGNNGGGTQNTDCKYTYVLDANDGVFTVSVISEQTIPVPQNTTSTAQVTLKVPTGSFEVTNFQSLTAGASFEQNSRSNAPMEAPDFDYIVFGLTTLGTRTIEYTAGVKIPLFSFENGGICTGSQVFFMENFIDSFYPPNSENANANQQITVAATGSDLSIICNNSNEISDCGENIGDPTEPTNLPTDTIYVTLPVEETTTLCIGDELNIAAANIGTVALCSGEGTVITSLTDGSNCFDITTDDHFNQSETLCIVHFDATDNSISDTTIFRLCPKVTLGADLEVCAGETVTLNPLGGTGNFTWITDGNISCTDCANPEITPDGPTQYILMSTENDHCIDTDTLMVVPIAGPNITAIDTIQPTNCEANGQISITAEGGIAPLKYSIDNGTTYQETAQFDDLGAGDFIILVANQDEVCSATGSTPISLAIEGAPEIVDLMVTPPNACKDEKGAIFIQANSSNETDIIEYSVDSGMTWQTENLFSDLEIGGYNVVFRIQGSNCEAAFENNPVTISQTADLRITTPPGDQIVCSESDRNIQLELSETIAEYTITGGAFSNDNSNEKLLTFETDPAAEGSLYTVMLTGESGCSITEEFTLTPGENADEWMIDISTIPASCENNDGSIAVTVNGNNNGFSFCWEPNKASGPSRDELNSDSTYQLTVTGSSGCTVTFDNIMTGTTCNVVSCNIFTGLDTLNAFVVNEEATACIPIENMDLSEFQFYSSGELQQMQFGECMQTSVFYDYGMLFELGGAPFNLIEWSVNNDTLRDFQFSTIEELATKMNQFDFQANWVVNETLTAIQGFSTSNIYGTLKVQANGSSQIPELPITTMNTMFQSIILDGTRGIKKYTIKDPLNDCEDDIYIKVQGLEDGVDTLDLATVVNTPILGQCLKTDETGTENLTIKVCNEPNVGVLNGIDGGTDECFGYTPNRDFLGKDFFCLTLCNDNICDTTIVRVTISEEGLVFYNGFSPNNDGMNDVFTIKNIENYPENNVLIYNRWGNQIFKKENYTNDEGWDGNFGEALSPDGVYFYVVKVTISEVEQIFSGPITLYR
ncbi:MAG: gliding motility-associated C-terminal domain-containing protein [Saprospiraceae bacterium]